MKQSMLTSGLCAVFLLTGGMWACAGDLDDGITTYTDESVAADDAIGSNKDTNINFIIVDAIGKAKSDKKNDDKENANEKEVTNIVDKRTAKNGAEQDNNVNSIVVEAGSNVDKVTNIVIEK